MVRVTESKFHPCSTTALAARSAGIPTNAARSSALMEEYACDTKLTARFRVDSNRKKSGRLSFKEVYPQLWGGRVENHFEKPSSVHPTIGSRVYFKSSVLDHAATKVGRSRKLPPCSHGISRAVFELAVTEKEVAELYYIGSSRAVLKGGTTCLDELVDRNSKTL
uniref:Uncharacterized protein n=1 Tax=Timema bartmani TaxID=61472 RepID=A0A7R9HWZ2_9NEOP|nr:unnamed protein product [Timema bartmani]